MSIDSSVKSDRVDAVTSGGGISTSCDANWRATFDAALRVIDHHRANLEARMTIGRLRRDERRPIDDAGGPTLHR